MRPYLQHLLNYFKKDHVGDHWITNQLGNIRWTLEPSVWIEVTHRIKGKKYVYVHIATNNSGRFRTFIKEIPLREIEEIPLEFPHYRVKPGWFRLGCYINDHNESRERFALISRIVMKLANVYRQNRRRK